MLCEVRVRVIYTDKPWWTVEDAARLLRVNIHTLYRAIARDDFPHQKIGPYIKIPAEALFLTPLPETRSRTYHVSDEPEQMEFDFGMTFVPIKRYRDGSTRRLGDYEVSLSNKPWRNKETP